MSFGAATDMGSDIDDTMMDILANRPDNAFEENDTFDLRMDEYTLSLLEVDGGLMVGMIRWIFGGIWRMGKGIIRKLYVFNHPPSSSQSTFPSPRNRNPQN